MISVDIIGLCLAEKKTEFIDAIDNWLAVGSGGRILRFVYCTNLD